MPASPTLADWFDPWPPCLAVPCPESSWQPGSGMTRDNGQPRCDWPLKCAEVRCESVGGAVAQPPHGHWLAPWRPSRQTSVPLQHPTAASHQSSPLHSRLGPRSLLPPSLIDALQLTLRSRGTLLQVPSSRGRSLRVSIFFNNVHPYVPETPTCRKKKDRYFDLLLLLEN